MNGLLLGLASFLLLSVGIPEDIYEITWRTPNRNGGNQFVIYKDDSGANKAIWQDEGIYVFVEQSIIYDVSFEDDKLYFKNGLRVSSGESTPVVDISLTYSSVDTAFTSQEGTEYYKVISERPIIYSKYGWLISIEKLKSDSLDESDFE